MEATNSEKTWDEMIMCLHNNNIPISIPSHPYVLLNRHILCNCDVEAENNFLLESLAACENSETKTDLEMNFTVNLAFVNYFDKANRRIRYSCFKKLDNPGTSFAIFSRNI